MNYSGDRILLGSQRESRISKFRPWVLLVVPLIAILFQVYVPLFFQFLAYLDMPLLVTVYFALMRRSPIAGTFIGAFIGLAQDSLSKNPLGMYGIVKTLVGYFAASVGLRQAARRRSTSPSPARNRHDQARDALAAGRSDTTRLRGARTRGVRTSGS